MSAIADIVEHNKQLARSLLLDVWRDGNYELIPELLQPDYERIQPGQSVRGLEGFRTVLDRYRNAFTRLEYTLHHMVADERFVAVSYSVSGLHSGAFQWIPPSGREGTVMCLDFFEVRDGKLARAWTLSDDLGMLRMIGLHVIPGPVTALKALGWRLKKLFKA